MDEKITIEDFLKVDLLVEENRSDVTLFENDSNSLKVENEGKGMQPQNCVFITKILQIPSQPHEALHLSEMEHVVGASNGWLK